MLEFRQPFRSVFHLIKDNGLPFALYYVVYYLERTGVVVSDLHR